MKEKVAIFIDAANLSYVCKALQTNIDFNKFLPHLRSEYQWDIVNAFFYTALVKDEKSGFISRHNQMDWLRYHGFTTKVKQAKQYTRADGTIRTKGNMDIEIAVGMMRAAESRNIQRLVLMSGDGDFRELIEYLQETKGIPVTVMSTKPLVSNDLRAVCNQYVDIRSFIHLVEERKQHVEVVKASSIVDMLHSKRRGVK